MKDLFEHIFCVCLAVEVGRWVSDFNEIKTREIEYLESST